MSRHAMKEIDPLSELYDVASALRFLEDAFGSHDECETQVRAGGAAYVTRLMGLRLGDIAGALWELEDKPHNLAPQAPWQGAPCPPRPDGGAEIRAQARPASRMGPAGSSQDAPGQRQADGFAAPRADTPADGRPVGDARPPAE